MPQHLIAKEPIILRTQCPQLLHNDCVHTHFTSSVHSKLPFPAVWWAEVGSGDPQSQGRMLMLASEPFRLLRLEGGGTGVHILFVSELSQTTQAAAAMSLWALACCCGIIVNTFKILFTICDAILFGMVLETNIKFIPNAGMDIARLYVESYPNVIHIKSQIIFKITFQWHAKNNVDDIKLQTAQYSSSGMMIDECNNGVKTKVGERDARGRAGQVTRDGANERAGKDADKQNRATENPWPSGVVAESEDDEPDIVRACNGTARLSAHPSMHGVPMLGKKFLRSTMGGKALGIFFAVLQGCPPALNASARTYFHIFFRGDDEIGWGDVPMGGLGNGGASLSAVVEVSATQEQGDVLMQEWSRWWWYW
ncbi:hypothetical protein BD779DRAFT_1479195 [Infundibulicybe gibba]|nr:hypothetical protein BD779DRAFT_1479195 [Infundibulicybe gibba]